MNRNNLELIQEQTEQPILDSKKSEMVKEITKYYGGKTK